MAAKKRVKPIRISLTEEQIAEVIRNTVKSRRGFNVESLEDRIAPSRIGLPLGGGVEDGIGGDGPPEVGGGDPTIGSGDPPLPGGDPGLPGGEPPLPGGEPPLPGGEPPLPGGEPPLPGLDPMGGSDPFIDPLGDTGGGGAHHQFMGGQDFSNPDTHFDQGPGDGTGRFGDRAGMTPEQRQDPRLQHEPDVNPEPDVSPEELQQHRQAILRQLRGGGA